MFAFICQCSNMKECTKCKLQKPFDQFYKSKAFGLTHYCKSCDTELRKRREDPNYIPNNRAKTEELGKLIEMPDGRFRKKIRYRNSFANHYYKKVKCSMCETELLRECRNISRQKYFFCEKCTPDRGKLIYNPTTKVKTSGHILVYAPEHPFAYVKYVPQHRLVVEEAIGRYLTKEEIVHHIDCIKDNNVIENLFVTTQSGHNVAHNSLNQCVKPLMEMGILIFKNGIYQINNHE